MARLRYELRALAGQSPLLFHGLIRLRRRKAAFAVARDTEVVIEGFPRSGNTFATAAFLDAQGREVRVARHLHVPAQILAAARASLPAILLIRHPLDCVLSTAIRHPELTLRQVVRDYVRFHRACFDLRPYYVLGPFEQVTTDFGAVVDRLNARFGTTFRSFDHTPEALARVRRRVERMDLEDTGRDRVTEATVARPSGARRAAKDRLLERVESDADLLARFEEAAGLYAEILGTLDRDVTAPGSSAAASPGRP